MKLRLTVLIIVFLTAAAAAQDKVEPVILLKGPSDTLGLPLGYSNSVPCQSGTYGFDDSLVGVYFTDIPMELGAAWSSSSCGRYSLVTREGETGSVSYYWDSRGWGVFIDIPQGVPSCDFITPFLERLTYFQSISDSFSFPAILER